jgi:hypothetical protein
LITAIDSSILLDVLKPDPRFGPQSASAIKVCRSEGELIACDVVWAELASALPSREFAQKTMARLAITFSPLRAESAFAAGDLWRAYRASGGGRDRNVPDFLIGAHALGQADRLLTRDRGFYRKYFRKLTILDPTAG